MGGVSIISNTLLRSRSETISDLKIIMLITIIHHSSIQNF